MKDKVDIVAILSMSDKEIRDALKVVSVTCLLIYFITYVLTSSRISVSYHSTR